MSESQYAEGFERYTGWMMGVLMMQVYMRIPDSLVLKLWFGWIWADALRCLINSWRNANKVN